MLLQQRVPHKKAVHATRPILGGGSLPPTIDQIAGLIQWCGSHNEGALRLYELPTFLAGRVAWEVYSRWLGRKAAAHVKRDRLRTALPLTSAVYKQQIHAAVCASGGVDWYTGEPLAWEKISTYDNEASRLDRSIYKAGFALLPTVDHVLRSDGAYDFVICGWRTNDAKNDLSLSEFLILCKLVVARHDAEVEAI